MSAGPRADVFLNRMRANASMALAEGATLADVEAHILAIARGVTRPGLDELTDGAEVAELATTLTGFRAITPGEVSR